MWCGLGPMRSGVWYDGILHNTCNLLKSVTKKWATSMNGWVENCTRGNWYGYMCNFLVNWAKTSMVELDKCFSWVICEVNTPRKRKYRQCLQDKEQAGKFTRIKIKKELWCPISQAETSSVKVIKYLIRAISEGSRETILPFLWNWCNHSGNADSSTQETPWWAGEDPGEHFWDEQICLSRHNYNSQCFLCQGDGCRGDLTTIHWHSRAKKVSCSQ